VIIVVLESIRKSMIGDVSLYAFSSVYGSFSETYIFCMPGAEQVQNLGLSVCWNLVQILTKVLANILGMIIRKMVVPTQKTSSIY
jgi:hypothetical protein